MKNTFALLIITAILLTACQKTPEELIVSSKKEDIQQVIIKNDEQEKHEEIDNTIAPQNNHTEEQDDTKTDYYQTPETYVNQFSQANVDMFVDARIYGPEDNKIVSAVLEDKMISQELADEFISYFVGDAELYEKADNMHSKEEYAEEITYWKEVVFNCETKWDDMRNSDPYAEFDNSADAIDEFERIIRSLELDAKSAPDKTIYKQTSKEFSDNKIVAYAQNTEGSFKDMANIIIRDVTSGKGVYLGSLLYDNKGSWRDSNLTLEEVYANSGLTLDYAIEQANIAAKHFGIEEISLDWYRICRHFKDGKTVPFFKMSMTPAINNIGSPTLDDSTQLGYGAVAMAPGPRPESIDVSVDPDGIIEFSWNYPKNTIEIIDDDVKIMGFDEIIDTFEQKILYTLYMDGDSKREVHIKKIELSLMPIKKIDSSKTVLVPVWDFRGYFFDPNDEVWANSGNVVNEIDIFSFFTVNAIDGSIIDRSLGY